MGKHFDSIDGVLAKPLMIPNTVFGIDIGRFLKDHRERTEVTDIPFHSAYLQAISGKTDDEYNEFLSEYTKSLDQSQFFQRTPRGIEDPQSYVGVQFYGQKRYVLTSCMDIKGNTILESGIIKNPSYQEDGIRSRLDILFSFVISNDAIAFGKREYTAVDLANAFTAYVEEAAYLDSLLE